MVRASLNKILFIIGFAIRIIKGYLDSKRFNINRNGNSIFPFLIIIYNKVIIIKQIIS